MTTTMGGGASVAPETAETTMTRIAVVGEVTEVEKKSQGQLHRSNRHCCYAHIAAAAADCCNIAAVVADTAVV